jgi:hypothetical protein
MEFDNNSPVSDDQRRLAETKRITLQPMHVDIAPEPIPEAEAAASYASQPMAANIDIDTEQNASLIQPSKGLVSNARSNSRHTATKVIAAVSTVTLICIGVATLLLIQK